MKEEYVKFFLDSKKSIIEFETIQITHPSFDREFYVVRNSACGLTAKIEENVSVNFEYIPMRVRPTTAKNDLDFGVEIVFGDLGELLPSQIKRVFASVNKTVKPELIYRGYRSDDLEQPMNGPFVLEIQEISFNKQGAVFRAEAPTVNLSKTGEIYTTQRFKGLKGL